MGLAEEKVDEESIKDVEIKSSPRPSWLSGLMLMLGSLFIAIVGFELCFRGFIYFFQTEPPRKDRPKIFFAPSNSKTAADFYHTPEKPAGTFRMVAIGDSFTYPSSMQLDDAFPKRLERMLNLSGSKAEVLNFGLRGESTVSEVAKVEKALRFNPDLILLEITLNDPEPTYFEVASKKNPEKFNFQKLEITEKSHPILYYFKSLGYLAQRVQNTRTIPGMINYHKEMYQPGKRWDDFTAALKKMKAHADNAHVPFAAVIFPLFYTPLDDAYPFKTEHQQISDYLKSIGVQHLDLFEAFRGMNPLRLTVTPGEDTHPNENAHRIAADKIYLWLENYNFIPEAFRVKERFLRRGGVISKHAPAPTILTELPNQKAEWLETKLNTGQVLK